MHTLVNKTNVKDLKFDETYYNADSKMDEKLITISETKVCMTKFLKNLNSSKNDDNNDVERKTRKCIDSILGNMEIVGMLSKIRHLDDYTFEHSVHVSLLSIYAAIFLGYKPNEIYDIGVGAILHDVGKTMIARNILKKPTKLTKKEYTEIKRHTQYGFDIISEATTVSKKAALIAKHHHERLNGSGYPDGLTDLKLKKEIRVVAIADVYDALVSERIYRERWEPKKVLDYIMIHEKGNFDFDILKVFLKFIGIYPIGTRVLLNNQETGIVIKDNNLFPSKPVIKLKKKHLIRNSKVKVIEEELDLSLNNDIYISECF